MDIKNEANMPEQTNIKLQEICNSLINKISSLDLKNFGGIKVVEDKFFNIHSDGKTDNNVVLLPRNKMNNYLRTGKEDLVKSTIYHELCHIDLSNKFPNLHSLFEYYIKNENFVKGYTIMIYIEYLVVLKSLELETEENKKEFFKSITDKTWNFNNTKDKITFVKCAPYIIARDTNNNFVDTLANNEFKARISEIRTELVSITPIDEYDVLGKLEGIVGKYIAN